MVVDLTQFPAKEFLTSNIDILEGFQKLCGDLFRLHAPGKTIVVAFNPQDVRAIHENEGKYPAKAGFAGISFYRQRREDLYRGNRKRSYCLSFKPRISFQIFCKENVKKTGSVVQFRFHFLV